MHSSDKLAVAPKTAELYRDITAKMALGKATCSSSGSIYEVIVKYVPQPAAALVAKSAGRRGLVASDGLSLQRSC